MHCARGVLLVRSRRDHYVLVPWRVPKPIGHRCPSSLSAPWLQVVGPLGVAERTPSQSLWDCR
eukprot:6184176-Pleurochrysis_carterae.AAC.1